MSRHLRVPVALTALALGGWIAAPVATHGMTDMDAPGPVASFLWLWIALSAAMMLPSLVPAASLAAHLGRSVPAFVVGYAVVWSATGMLVCLGCCWAFDFELHGTCAFTRAFEYTG